MPLPFTFYTQVSSVLMDQFACFIADLTNGKQQGGALYIHRPGAPGILRSLAGYHGGAIAEDNSDSGSAVPASLYGPHRLCHAHVHGERAGAPRRRRLA